MSALDEVTDSLKGTLRLISARQDELASFGLNRLSGIFTEIGMELANAVAAKKRPGARMAALRSLPSLDLVSLLCQLAGDLAGASDVQVDVLGAIPKILLNQGNASIAGSVDPDLITARKGKLGGIVGGSHVITVTIEVEDGKIKGARMEEDGGVRWSSIPAGRTRLSIQATETPTSVPA